MDRVSTSSKSLARVGEEGQVTSRHTIKIWSARKVGAQYLAERLSHLQVLTSGKVPLHCQLRQFKVLGC